MTLHRGKATSWEHSHHSTTFRPGRRRLLSRHCNHPDPNLGKTGIEYDHGHKSTALPFWVQLVFAIGMPSQVHFGHKEHPGQRQRQSESKSGQTNGQEVKEKGAKDRQRGREKRASAAKTEKDGRSKNGKRRTEGEEENGKATTTSSNTSNS